VSIWGQEESGLQMRTFVLFVAKAQRYFENYDVLARTSGEAVRNFADECREGSILCEHILWTAFHVLRDQYQPNSRCQFYTSQSRTALLLVNMSKVR